MNNWLTFNTFNRHFKPLPFPLSWRMLPKNHSICFGSPSWEYEQLHVCSIPVNTSEQPPHWVWPRKREIKRAVWSRWLASIRRVQFTVYCSCDYYWIRPRKAPKFWHASDFPVCMKLCQEHLLKEFLSFFQDSNYAPNNVVEMSVVQKLQPNSDTVLLTKGLEA